VLPCAPPRIEFWYFYPSRRKLRQRSDSDCTNSHLHKTDEVVDAVKSNCCENVGDGDRFVKTDL
jgi:hypothetical protein